MIATKKLSNGFEIPIFGLGTWLFGGDKVRDPSNNDKGQIEAIRNCIASGITHIDTAENYAEGQAETLVGEAIKGFDRKQLFLVSKVDKTHLKYDDLIAACKNSLLRLKTDYLDLYLIHSPNDWVPIAETMRAMDKLVETGLVKNIGVSNFTTKRLVETQNLTNHKIVVNQVYYNLINREPEKEGLLKYCQENDVILEAYRPLNKGAMLVEVPSIMKVLCEKYKKTPAQVALNWLISQKNVVTISKMSSMEHAKEALGALDWIMDEVDIGRLREFFPGQIERPEKLSLS